MLLFYIVQLFLRELCKSKNLIRIVPMDMTEYYGNFDDTSIIRHRCQNDEEFRTKESGELLGNNDSCLFSTFHEKWMFINFVTYDGIQDVKYTILYLMQIQAS